MRWLSPSPGAGQAARPGPCLEIWDLHLSLYYTFFWGLDVDWWRAKEIGEQQRQR